MEESNYITDYITWENVFNQEECQNIIKLYNSEEIVTSLSLSKPVPPKTRNFYDASQTGWILKRLEQGIRHINQQSYNFNLSRLSDFVQIIKFTPNDFLSWQKDLGIGRYSTRKLSVILFLSERGTYKGGEMEWFGGKATNDNTDKVKSRLIRENRGNLVIFPSYLPYQMKEMIKGEKYILMAWALGTHFY